MVWFTLALFVVSFIATALLAPKPQIENARAGELNPDSFPKASENSPIPLVIGKVDFRSPNTLWFGDFEALPIRETVKAGLFKKKKVVTGFRYFLGLDLAIGLGPGMVLREIFIDDKSIWSGATSPTEPTEISIDKPDFFGGLKNGGGIVGDLTFYPGSFDQQIDPYLQSVIGSTNVPAYTGISHIVFKKVEIGEQPTLRKISFIVERYPSGLPVNPPLGKIGDDYNPADAIYEITTNSWSGLGLDSSFLDLDSLSEIGNTLKTEGNGVSILVTSENDGKRVISEILRQIDGIAFQDPISGKIKFDLIRKDYVLEDLPIFDENDIVKINSISRSSWEEVFSQAKVNFKQRGKESEGVAVAQNTGNIAMFGKIRSTTVSFPFLYNKETANKLAARELSQLSVPLFNATMELNRRAFNLKPGSVFKFSWAEYGISEMVVRIQRFNLGDLLDGKITIKVLQDNFSSKDAVFAVPEDSLFEEIPGGSGEIQSPLELDAPYFIQNAVNVSSFSDDGEIRSIPDGDGVKIIIPKKPTSASSAFVYNSIAGGLDSNSGRTFSSRIPYGGYGLLNSEYSRLNGIETGIDTSSSLTVKNVISTFSAENSEEDIRNAESGLLYINGEWIGYLTTTVNGDGTITFNNVYRGLFGSQVRDHGVDSEVFEYNSSLSPLPTPVLEEGEVMNYTMVDISGDSAGDPVDFVTSVLGQTARRPMRIGDLRIDGSRSNIEFASTDTVSVTGKTRNRKSFQVEFETDANDMNTIWLEYDLEVYIDDIINPTLSVTSINKAGHNINFSSASVSGFGGEIRVWTRDLQFSNLKSIGYSFLPFKFTNPPLYIPIQITGNGISDLHEVTVWTQESGSGVLAANQNGYYSESGSGVWHQNIQVPSSIHDEVDNGNSQLYFEYQHYQDFDSDEGGVRIEFLNQNSELISTANLGIRTISELRARYKFFLDFQSIPANTRTIRIVQEHVLISGSDANAQIGSMKGSFWVNTGDQLLVDPDFELADPAWVMERSMTIDPVATVASDHSSWNGNNPNLKSNMLSCGIDSEARATQTVDVSSYSASIDAGSATVSGLVSWIKTFDDGDFIDFDLDFLDATDTLISTDSGTLTVAPNASVNDFNESFRDGIQIPIGTRKIVFAVTGELVGGSLINAIAYNSKLWIKTS